jgi:arabinofuranosyltransferase
VGSWTNQWILGVIALSLIFVLFASALLIWQAASLGRLIIVIGFLLMSNAFIDFTTSGLENPLAFAVIAVLITLSLRNWPDAHPPWWWATLVGVTCAATVLTRMDLIVLIVMPIIVLAWHHRRNARVLAIAVGAFLAPIALWFTWSYGTYSALLPNTFAAKTNAEIPRSEFIVQGIRYLWVSFENDPVTLIGLAIGLGLGITVGPGLLRSWSFGALAYIAYVVWIGGDFMGGRFLAVPFFVAIFVLAASPIALSRAEDPESRDSSVTGAVAAMTLLFVATYITGIQTTALANPQQPRWEVDQNFNAGVSDERGFSLQGGDSLKSMVDTLSLAFVDPDFAPIGDGTGLGRPLRNLDKSAKNWPVNDGTFTLPAEVGVFCGFLGNIGIATGPTVHLVDYCALTDRYLAEKPFVPTEPFAWKPGHFGRVVPEEYVEAIATDDPSKLREPADIYALRNLWEKIRD